MRANARTTAGPRDPRYLIVNGDDFGLSAGVSRGIVEAHRRGILTSTSLMVDRPAAEDAARRALEVPDLSVGLHLELDGARGQRDAAQATRRQLRRFEELLGRAPTHVDSHHDRHRDPGLLPGVLEAVAGLELPVRGSSPATCLTRFYGAWGGELHPEQVSVASLVGMLHADVGAGVSELACHPGYAERDLASSYAEMREPELRTLCDPRVRVALGEAGIRLIGFRELASVASVARAG